MPVKPLPDEITDYILNYLNLLDCISLSMANVLPGVDRLLRRRKSFKLSGCQKIPVKHFCHLIEECIDYDHVRFLHLGHGQDLPPNILSQVITSTTQLEELYLEEFVRTNNSLDEPSTGLSFFYKTLFQFIRKQLMLDSSITQGYCQYHLTDSGVFFPSIPPSFKLNRLRKLIYSTAAPCDCAFRAIGELLSISPNIQNLQIKLRSGDAIDISRLPWNQISKLEHLRQLSISCDNLSTSNFVEVLNRCRHLNRLHLHGRLTEDLGAMFGTLIPVVLHQTTVRQLSLTCGPLELQGMRSTIERLQDSHQLERLDLRYPQVDTRNPPNVDFVVITCYFPRNSTRG